MTTKIPWNEQYGPWALVTDAAMGIGEQFARQLAAQAQSLNATRSSKQLTAVLLATRASLVCRSQTGERVIAAREFFLDTFTTAIEPTEVLTEIRIPPPAPGTRSSYRKVRARRSWARPAPAR